MASQLRKKIDRAFVVADILVVLHNVEFRTRVAARIAANHISTCKANSKTSTVLVVVTNRRIRSDVLRYSGRLARRVVENVAEDAARGGVFCVLARSARVLQLVRVFVLLGVQHVGAFGAEAEGDLFEVLLGGGGVVGRR